MNDTSENLDPIVPCLWFDRNAEEAVAFYLSVFPNSRIAEITRYPKTGHPAHEGREGEVLVIHFELRGQRFMALNGGPYFQFNEAVSLSVECESQEEIDRYWELLGAGGDPEAQQCGWVKDRFGLSWQIVPRQVCRLYQSEDPAANERAMKAMMEMRKLDGDAIRAAAAIVPDRPGVLRFHRRLPFPPEEVFAAFTDPARLRLWWGPKGFTNEFRTCDIEPGGDWIFDMIGPDGTRHPNESRFISIEPPHRIVIEHLREVHYFLLTVTLSPRDYGTYLEWEMDFRDAAEVERILPYVPRCNEELFDRLEGEIARASAR